MTSAEHINAYIRDSQYRIAELTIEQHGRLDKSSLEYKELCDLRLDMVLLLRTVYLGKWEIYPNTRNLVGHIQDWTDVEIQLSIDEVRSRASISDIPWFEFAGYQVVFVQN
jgi:hypothetical protein